MALYATVGIITGLEIGYVSLAVGFIVGKAMLMGSAGRRGRRYQIAAVALTYVAVSMSSVTIVVGQAIGAGTISLGRAVSVFGSLVLTGLASPFLGLSSAVSGVIGLVILFVGMQIAWRMTAAVPVTVAAALASRTPPDDTPTSLGLNK